MDEQASFVSLNPIQTDTYLVGIWSECDVLLLLFFLSLLIYIFKKKDKIRHLQILNNVKKQIIKYMEKFNLRIPNVEYLSEWLDLDKALKQYGNKIIVNKIVCGCGMTDYYLTETTMPVILASPRRELIVSKKKEPRTQHAYYFDRSDINISQDESVEKLHDFLKSSTTVPKIMCTYDSLETVINKLHEWRWLDDFVVIGDEMTCIFTDAPMKGSRSMEIVNLFDKIPNRCIFITATPLKEAYLDDVPVFKNMTYVSFEWPQDRLLPIYLTPKKMTGTIQAIGDIIDAYRHYGYFQEKCVEGNMVYSKEAVFYLNSLTDIIKIVKKKELTKIDTRIICADNPENNRDLKNIGFEIGHFPGKLDYKTENKTFTFATRCSFEGADLHSDCASVYIFSDSNRNNLSLDISIDLVQIIGRCRTYSNPFRDQIQYYYKFMATQQLDADEARKNIDKKLKASMVLYNKFKDETMPEVLDFLEDAQNSYSKNYITVVKDGPAQKRVEINQLVRLAELRAVDIKEQYNSRKALYTLLLDNRIVPQSNYAGLNPQFAQFLQEFDDASSFSDKMRIFAERCNSNIQIWQWAQNCPLIPLSYKNYYGLLGIDKIRQLQYDSKKLDSELAYCKCMPRIVGELSSILQIGSEYTSKLLKTTIQAVYDKIGLKKTAKATQIKDFFPMSYETKVHVAKGYDNGYRIYN